jgi:hypothetical protein
MTKKKYILKKKFENCLLHSELGSFLLTSKLSQKTLKLLYDNGHHDKINYE